MMFSAYQAADGWWYVAWVRPDGTHSCPARPHTAEKWRAVREAARRNAEMQVAGGPGTWNAYDAEAAEWIVEP